MDSDIYTVTGLPRGHWHKSLELPSGYQHFNWYKPGANPNGVFLDEPKSLISALNASASEGYLYTHHQVLLDDGVIKHTRSSPNWEGGLVTYSTCKHLMRTYREGSGWIGTWLVGLCPKECAGNCLLFAGVVREQFDGNYDLSRRLCKTTKSASAYLAKRADDNPRGDLYTPLDSLTEDQRYDHLNFHEPVNHTRSVEAYKKSPGSDALDPSGKIPKWWRDIEYCYNGRRPPVFILSPCWLFSAPTLWSSYQPRRATMRLASRDIAGSLRNVRG